MSHDAVYSEPPGVGCDVDSWTGSLLGEYKTLSRAVHGYPSFRMTGATQGTQLWSSEKASLGAWETREIHTLGAANMTLISIFRHDLEGAKLPLLRQAVARCIPAAKNAQYKSELKITLG